MSDTVNKYNLSLLSSPPHHRPWEHRKGGDNPCTAGEMASCSMLAIHSKCGGARLFGDGQCRQNAHSALFAVQKYDSQRY